MNVNNNNNIIVWMVIKWRNMVIIDEKEVVVAIEIWRNVLQVFIILVVVVVEIIIIIIIQHVIIYIIIKIINGVKRELIWCIFYLSTHKHGKREELRDTIWISNRMEQKQQQQRKKNCRLSWKHRSSKHMENLFFSTDYSTTLIVLVKIIWIVCYNHVIMIDDVH